MKPHHWAAVPHVYPLPGGEELVIDLADDGALLEAPKWFETLDYEEQTRLLAEAWEYTP